MQTITEQDVNQLLQETALILSEDQLRFLTENRVEYIKTANKDKISTAHDPESSGLSSDKIIDTIANKIDPDSKKSHTQWLVKQYHNGAFKLKEGKGIKKLLTEFDTLHNNILDKNYNKFDLNEARNIDHLKDVVAPARGKLEDKKKSADATKEMPVVFKEGDSVGYEVPNKETSIENYGPHGKLARTRWCTASEGSNMFNGYKGDLYTLHLPNGKVLQAHHTTGQLSNEENVNIDVNSHPYSEYKDTIHDFINKTAELKGKGPVTKLTQKYATSPEHVTDDVIQKHKDIITQLKDAASRSTYIDYNKREQETKARNEVLDNAETNKLSDSAFEYVKALPEFTYDNNVRHTSNLDRLAKNHALKPHQMNEVIDHANKNSRSNDLLMNSSLNDEQKHKLINGIIADKDTRDANVFAEHGKNLKPEHFEKLMSFFPSVENNLPLADKSSQPPTKYFDGLKHTKEAIMSASPHIPEHIAEEYAKTKTGTTLRTLIQNKAVNKEHARTAANRLGKSLTVPVNDMLNRPDADVKYTSAVADDLLADKYTADNNYWPANSKIDRTTARKVLFGKAPKDLKESALDNRNIRSKDLEEFVATKQPYSPYSILRSTSLNSHIAEKILETTPEHAQYVANHVVQNKDISSPKLVGNLLKAKIDFHTKHKLIQDANAQLHHFESIKDDPRFHGALSVHKNTPPSILRELGNSPFNHVRENVLHNPNTPSDVVAMLKAEKNTNTESQ